MKELQVIEKGLKPSMNQATDFKCKTKNDYEHGGELLKIFKQAEKQTKVLKDRALQPSLETTKQIRDYFRPMEENLSECILQVKGQMKDWMDMQNRKLEEAKQKILSDGRLKQETVELKIAALPTANGNTRRERKLKVNDISLIPMEYFDLNESRLKVALLEGKEIPGATLVNEVQIVTGR